LLALPPILCHFFGAEAGLWLPPPEAEVPQSDEVKARQLQETQPADVDVADSPADLPAGAATGRGDPVLTASAVGARSPEPDGGLARRQAGR